MGGGAECIDRVWEGDYSYGLGESESLGTRNVSAGLQVWPTSDLFHSDIDVFFSLVNWFPTF